VRHRGDTHALPFDDPAFSGFFSLRWVGEATFSSLFFIAEANLTTFSFVIPGEERK
jgi:hypothetical protein